MGHRGDRGNRAFVFSASSCSKEPTSVVECPAFWLRPKAALGVQSHFPNIALDRSPRESRYAIRSRISPSLNVSSKPSGIIDTGDRSIDSTLCELTRAIPPGSSMLVITDMLSPW